MCPKLLVTSALSRGRVAGVSAWWGALSVTPPLLPHPSPDLRVRDIWVSVKPVPPSRGRGKVSPVGKSIKSSKEHCCHPCQQSPSAVSPSEAGGLSLSVQVEGAGRAGAGAMERGRGSATCQSPSVLHPRPAASPGKPSSPFAGVLSTSQAFRMLVTYLSKRLLFQPPWPPFPLGRHRARENTAPSTF